MAMPGGEGLVHLASRHSVDETMQRLESLLNEKGVTVFARVDHGGEAAKVGLTMRPTKLLIFGNPKGGTPLMQAAPTIAIDLPLKALFGRTRMERCGSATTIRNICGGDTAWRRSWCRTSRG